MHACNDSCVDGLPENDLRSEIDSLSHDCSNFPSFATQTLDPAIESKHLPGFLSMSF